MRLLCGASGVDCAFQVALTFLLPSGWPCFGGQGRCPSGWERRVDEVVFRSDMTVDLVKHAAGDADVIWAARVSTRGEQSGWRLTVTRCGRRG